MLQQDSVFTVPQKSNIFKNVHEVILCGFMYLLDLISIILAYEYHEQRKQAVKLVST